MNFAYQGNRGCQRTIVYLRY
ncbi:hypothetical protein F01_440105 [Burkholderia cenocepacia]|nr:hypothetical protein F01_440105 [Burkholderia cenocepacia]